MLFTDFERRSVILKLCSGGRAPLAGSAKPARVFADPGQTHVMGDSVGQDFRGAGISRLVAARYSHESRWRGKARESPHSCAPHFSTDAPHSHTKARRHQKHPPRGHPPSHDDAMLHFTGESAYMRTVETLRFSLARMGAISNLAVPAVRMRTAPLRRK